MEPGVRGTKARISLRRRTNRIQITEDKAPNKYGVNDEEPEARNSFTTRTLASALSDVSNQEIRSKESEIIVAPQRTKPPRGHRIRKISTSSEDDIFQRSVDAQSQSRIPSSDRRSIDRWIRETEGKNAGTPVDTNSTEYEQVQTDGLLHRSIARGCFTERASQFESDDDSETEVAKYQRSRSRSRKCNKRDENADSPIFSRSNNTSVNLEITHDREMVHEGSNVEDFEQTEKDVYNSPEIVEMISRSPIMDGVFFKVSATILDTNHVPVRCQSCADKKELVGSFTASTNLVKHLRRVHPDVHEKYLAHKRGKRRENRKRKSSASSRDATSAKRSRVVGRFGIDADDFEDRVLRFIVETMSPLSTTDHPSFRDLFRGMNVKHVSRRTLTKRLIDMDTKRFNATKELLSKTDFVCTTADIWSARRRSFIGVTCHYIDEDFRRQSLPLSCKRFKGTHSFDNIAKILHEVHASYGLTREKIVATVTDNARNFVKAFTEFGIHLNSVMLANAYSEAVNDSSAGAATLGEEFCSDDEDGSSSDVECIPIDSSLPVHLRCASHTLNLVATSDLLKTIEGNEQLQRRHTQTVAKCSKLWHKAALPKSAEVFADTIGHTFSYPIVTRWNSLYDALKQIVNEKDALPMLFKRLEIKDTFTASDALYVHEYCEVMSPIAQALDILQSEEKLYYGMLLPTLITLRRRVQMLTEGHLKYGQTLARSCLNGINTRFADILSFRDGKRSLIAMIAHPAFKLKWIEKANATYKLRVDLINARESFMEKGAIYSRLLTPCSQQSNDSFSSFFRINASQTSDIDSERNMNTQRSNDNNGVDVQLLTYLNDKRTDLSMLNDYPIVRRIFLNFNTPLPSSAPVERLFSFASIANTPRRHALTDKNFERIVLLKGFYKTGRKLD